MLTEKTAIKNHLKRLTASSSPQAVSEGGTLEDKIT